jgi:hypothetical protein
MKEAVHIDFATGTTQSTVIFGTSAAPDEAALAFMKIIAKRPVTVSHRSQSRQVYDW